MGSENPKPPKNSVFFKDVDIDFLIENALNSNSDAKLDQYKQSDVQNRINIAGYESAFLKGDIPMKIGATYITAAIPSIRIADQKSVSESNTMRTPMSSKFRTGGSQSVATIQLLFSTAHLTTMFPKGAPERAGSTSKYDLIDGIKAELMHLIAQLSVTKYMPIRSEILSRTLMPYALYKKVYDSILTNNNMGTLDLIAAITRGMKNEEITTFLASVNQKAQNENLSMDEYSGINDMLTAFGVTDKSVAAVLQSTMYRIISPMYNISDMDIATIPDAEYGFRVTLYARMLDIGFLIARSANSYGYLVNDADVINQLYREKRGMLDLSGFNSSTTKTQYTSSVGNLVDKILANYTTSGADMNWVADDRKYAVGGQVYTEMGLASKRVSDGGLGLAQTKVRPNFLTHPNSFCSTYIQSLRAGTSRKKVNARPINGSKEDIILISRANASLFFDGLPFFTINPLIGFKQTTPKKLLYNNMVVMPIEQGKTLLNNSNSDNKLAEDEKQRVMNMRIDKYTEYVQKGGESAVAAFSSLMSNPIYVSNIFVPKSTDSNGVYLSTPPDRTAGDLLTQTKLDYANVVSRKDDEYSLVISSVEDTYSIKYTSNKVNTPTDLFANIIFENCYEYIKDETITPSNDFGYTFIQVTDIKTIGGTVTNWDINTPYQIPGSRFMYKKVRRNINTDIAKSDYLDGSNETTSFKWSEPGELWNRESSKLIESISTIVEDGSNIFRVPITSKATTKMTRKFTNGAITKYVFFDNIPITRTYTDPTNSYEIIEVLVAYIEPINTYNYYKVYALNYGVEIIRARHPDLDTSSTPTAYFPEVDKDYAALIGSAGSIVKANQDRPITDQLSKVFGSMLPSTKV